MAANLSWKTPEASTVVLNHPIYYFDDGSLVVDVEIHRFRVHRSLLSRHSEFFGGETRPSSGTISSAIPSGASRHVILGPKQKIRAEDVERLLEHMYHDVPLHSDPTFRRAASILRVSGPDQLNFPVLHKEAKTLIQDLFQGHDTSSWPWASSGEATNTDHLHDALDLARKLDLHQVRKAILYTLVTTTEFDVSEGETVPQPLSSDVVDPHIHAPGPGSDLTSPETQSLTHEESMQGSISIPGSDTGSSPRRRVLSQSDAALCTSLMNTLIAHFTPILFTPAATPHMACTDVFAETWMGEIIQPALETGGVYKPLETLERMKNVRWEDKGLCQECCVEKREEWAQEQKVVWTCMDAWLGLNA